MFKDEAGGKLIVEFVGLIAKLNLYKMLEDKNVREWQRMLQKEAVNSITIESACLAGRNNIEK